MGRYIRCWIVIGFALMLAACGGGGGGDSGGGNPPNVIGAEGGTITTSDGLSISIPPGALSSPVLITPIYLAQTGVLGSPFPGDMFVGGTEFKPDGLVFLKPVTITIPLNRMLDAGTALTLFHYQPESGAWLKTDYALTLNADGNAASAAIDHFSTYAVAIGGEELFGYFMEKLADIESIDAQFYDVFTRVSEVYPVGKHLPMDISGENAPGYQCYKITGVGSALSYYVKDTQDESRNIEETLEDVTGELENADVKLSFVLNRDLVGDLAGRDVRFLAIYDVSVMMRVVRPVFTVTATDTALFPGDNTHISGHVRCGAEGMVNQTVAFTGTNYGMIAPTTKQTDNAGEAPVTYTAGDNAPAVETVTASYACCKNNANAQTLTDSIQVSILCDSNSAASFTVAPEALFMRSGEMAQLVLVAKDAMGETVDCFDRHFSSDRVNVATVGERGGQVLALNEGIAQITITVGQLTKTVQVTVMNEIDAHIDIEPKSVNLLQGESTLVTATLRNAAGEDITDGLFDWSSGNVELNQVSPAQGITTTVSAVGYHGISNVTAVDSARPINAVAKVLVGATVQINAQQDCIPLFADINVSRQLNATVRDPEGNLLNMYPLSWTSSNESVAVVDNTGNMTVLNNGITEIQAKINYAGPGDYSTTASFIMPRFPDDLIRTLIPDPYHYSDLRLTNTRGLVHLNFGTDSVKNSILALAAKNGWAMTPGNLTVLEINSNYQALVRYANNDGNYSILLMDYNTESYIDVTPPHTKGVGLDYPPVSLNDRGDVLFTPMSPYTQIILYKNGNFTFIDPPAPYTNISATDLNNNGVIVGVVTNPNANLGQGYIYKDGTFTYLPLTAISVNDNEQVLLFKNPEAGYPYDIYDHGIYYGFPFLTRPIEINNYLDIFTIELAYSGDPNYQRYLYHVCPF